MIIPSLTTLCAQKIANTESLFELSLSRQIPAEVLERMIIVNWNWFLKPSTTANSTSEFNLTTQSYKDFCVLCPVNDRIEEQFLYDSDQETHNFANVSRIFEFVREKGLIRGNPTEIYRSTDNHQRFIALNYYIPVSDRIDSTIFSVKIAQINLPSLKRQTVQIRIEDLSKINEKVKSAWSEKTYDKIKDFAIYYVNQLAKDNEVETLFNSSSIITDNRLYLAKHEKDEKEARSHLFGKYKGPKDWLLNIDTKPTPIQTPVRPSTRNQFYIRLFHFHSNR